MAYCANDFIHNSSASSQIASLSRDARTGRKGNVQVNSIQSIRYPLSILLVIAFLTSCSGSAIQPGVPASQLNVKAPAGEGTTLDTDFLGCPYQSGDVWQTNISSAQVDTYSAAYIKATIDGGGGGKFAVWAPKTNELINAATSSTPLVAVHGKVKWHTPYSPWPWASNFYISPMGDAHAMVLQGTSCQYFEGYDTTYSGGSLSMYNGGMWDLTKAFVRPSQGSISTASGIPIGLLAVRPEELTAGVILHAIGWDGVAHSWSQHACVSPAGKTDCTDSLAYKGPSSDTPMPYGAHIRLKAAFDDSSFPKEAKTVAEALKTYGAYGYDTGCCNSIPFVNDVNGAPVWTSADESAITKLTISNFDVVVAP